MTREAVASAPGRVNLIGEHTDYNGGFALPLALPQRTTARLRERSDGLVTAASSAPGMPPVVFEATTAPGDVTGWAAYVAGVFWALREAGHDVPGADVQIDSDVPPASGLSSSAALECSVLVALDRLCGLGLDRTTLALLGQRAENDYVGAPTGALDQMASLHGQPGSVILFDAHDVTAENVPCDLATAGLTLLVVDTHAEHQHAGGEYATRRASCEKAAAKLGVSTLREVQHEPLDSVLRRLDGDDVTLRRVRHVLTENARVLDTVALLRAGRVQDIGPLLTASHASMRDDYEISVPELDVAVEASLAAGAAGARMTGGGFGGSIVALVEAATAEPAAEAVRAAFAEQGFRPPTAFTVQPSAGARVDEESA